MSKTRLLRGSRSSNRWLWMMLAFMAVGLMGAGQAGTPAGAAHAASWEPFSFWNSDQYSGFEKVALLANVVIAVAGLVYG